MKIYYPIVAGSIALVVCAFGCGTSADDSQASAQQGDDDAGSNADSSAPERDASSGRRPTPPAKSDTPESLGFTLEGLRAWYLIGNEVTEGHDTLQLKVRAADPVEIVDLWLDDAPGIRLERDGDDFVASVDIKTLAPGEHTVLLAADEATQAFAELHFKRSHPYYTFVSNDWDTGDHSDASLARQQYLHDKHPELILTHFVGPYTFTETSVSITRAQTLVKWVTGLRDKYGDEVGLHIHPYCSFLKAASVPCRGYPSFRSDDGGPPGDSTGYTVVLGSYTESEMASLLQKAISIFVDNGLGKPTSFRAGGWTSEIHTLKALAAAGFVADASAANWNRLEEWDGVPGAILFNWNKEHWASIGDTTQPYYPNQNDILSDEAPAVRILELPNNGALVDYVSAAEMIDVFGKIWTGEPLNEPLMYSIGYHPVNFKESYKLRIDEALKHVDSFLASADQGPVVYARGSDLALVWKAPES